MENIYKKMGFIVGFLVLVLLIQNFFGEKGSEKFVLIVLLSMVLVNAENFGTFLSNNFKLKEEG